VYRDQALDLENLESQLNKGSADQKRYNANFTSLIQKEKELAVQHERNMLMESQLKTKLSELKTETENTKEAIAATKQKVQTKVKAIRDRKKQT
jgi:hypothetical protein